MKILVIEDNEEWRERFRAQIASISPDIEVVEAVSRDGAISLINNDQFDLVILDLELPARDGELKTAKEFGFAARLHIQKTTPGTPIIFHSAYGNESLPILKDSIRDAPAKDIFGTDELFPMLDSIDKAEVLDCLSTIQHMFDQITALDKEIELWTTPDDLQLSRMERRLIRIFTRRMAGNRVHVKRLAGGRSGAKTLSLEIFETTGRNSLSAVAKIASHEDVRDEHKKYRTQVSVLDIGHHAHYIDLVDAGAANRAGIFYKLADDYNTDLFSILRTDQTRAASIVSAIEEIGQTWRKGAPVQQFKIGDIRRMFISDDKLKESFDGPFPFDIDDVESTEVAVRFCPQHRDLHAGNLLVNSDSKAVLIDYGMVGIAPGCLDALVLELCILFNPDGRAIAHGWPNQDQASHWANLDTYISESPFPDFIKACRELAQSDKGPGRKGMLATAYGYAMRQLKYKEDNTPIILAVANSCIDAMKKL